MGSLCTKTEQDSSPQQYVQQHTIDIKDFIDYDKVNIFEAEMSQMSQMEAGCPNNDLERSLAALKMCNYGPRKIS